MKNLSKGTIILAGFNTAVILGSVYLAIISSSRGAKLLALERKRLELDEIKTRLTDELVARTSLNEVSEIADSLGLQKPENIFYLNQGEPVAQSSLKNF